jgi:hypothetical protein
MIDHFFQSHGSSGWALMGIPHGVRNPPKAGTTDVDGQGEHRMIGGIDWRSGLERRQDFFVGDR